MKKHRCETCKKIFSVDIQGRRESDYIKTDRYCDMTCNEAAIDIAEGRSIYWAVRNGFIESARRRRVLDLGGMHEFKMALMFLTPNVKLTGTPPNGGASSDRRERG